MVAVPPRASVNQVARAYDALVITVQVLEHLLRGPRERDPEKLDEIFHVRVCEHSLELRTSGEWEIMVQNVNKLKEMSALPAVEGNPDSTPIFKQI